MNPLNHDLIQEQGRQRPCRNCMKAGTNFSRCAKCRQVYYCSKGCQVADWKKHKPMCKAFTQQRADSREQVGAVVDKIRQKWLKKVVTTLPVLVIQLFTEEQFNQQPPQVVLALSVRFNYNYGTYMPTAPPRVCARLKEYGPDQRQPSYEQAKRQPDANRTKQTRAHFIHILFHDGYIEHYVCNIDPATVRGFAKDFGLSPSTYVHVDCSRLFARIASSNKIYDLASVSQPYKRMVEQNLEKCFDYFQEWQTDPMTCPWKRFVLNAYRMNESRNLRGTHVVIVHFLFDATPGRMLIMLKYEVVTMKRAKELVPAPLQQAYLCLSMPGWLPVLLVEEWGRDLFAVSSQPSNPPASFQFWNSDASDEVAEHFFNVLRTQLRFPSADSLQVPDTKF